MCLSIPLKIIEINGNKAKADISGTEMDVNIELIDDVGIGDYVLAHTGIAIEKISEDEAHKQQQLLKELTDYEDENPLE